MIHSVDVNLLLHFTMLSLPFIDPHLKNPRKFRHKQGYTFTLTIFFFSSQFQPIFNPPGGGATGTMSSSSSGVTNTITTTTATSTGQQQPQQTQGPCGGDGDFFKGTTTFWCI